MNRQIILFVTIFSLVWLFIYMGFRQEAFDRMVQNHEQKESFMSRCFADGHKDYECETFYQTWHENH